MGVRPLDSRKVIWAGWGGGKVRETEVEGGVEGSEGGVEGCCAGSWGVGCRVWGGGGGGCYVWERRRSAGEVIAVCANGQLAWWPVRMDFRLWSRSIGSSELLLEDEYEAVPHGFETSTFQAQPGSPLLCTDRNVRGKKDLDWSRGKQFAPERLMSFKTSMAS